MFTGKWEKGEVDGYKYWAKVYEGGTKIHIVDKRILPFSRILQSIKLMSG